MCRIANYLVTTSLVLAGALVAGPLHAANLDAASQVDAVTVYPDGASVTRVITLDLPAGDNTLIARDFPIGLDPSSLRVEGEGGAKLTIGAIDTKLPGPLLPQNLSEIDKRIEALNDQRADLQGLISAAEARRKLPSGLPRRHPRASAKRARPVRSASGARRSRRWPTRSQPPTARSVTPSARSA
ncbi:hypothetical protein J2R80_002594 [Bradyrhizobium sp. USDA 4541]|nr:hypothetical protein [Bradyrhizobium sp. USDA 4541]